MNPNFRALASAILLCAVMTPALGISVSFSSGNGGESFSSSTIYDLDDSTKLQEQAVLGESSISQTREMAGDGQNSVNQAVSGKGYSANNIISGTGSFRATTSTMTSAGGARLSQSLTGDGDLRAAVQGSAGTSASAQSAGVSNGELSTTQNLAVASGIYSGQSTSLKGEAGSIASASSSQMNDMSLAGGFSGEGDLRADLNAAASGQAEVGGDASFQGMPVLGKDHLRTVASDDVAMTVDALYAQSDGNLGSFGLSTVNTRKDSVQSDTSFAMIGPSYSSDGGRKDAYILWGLRWNQRDPQIKLYLKDDANLRNEGLDRAAVQNAVAAAANTWDDATNQNLFSDTGVTVSSSVNADTRDNKNVVAWRVPSSTNSCVAFARTWYSSSKVDGYRSILESDINLNTRYNWATNGANHVDVQTVVLHELGHTIGLGDLYRVPTFYGETQQIMSCYNDVQRTLGNGDKTGAWLLYG